MPIRLRKFLGLVVIVFWVVIYAFSAALWADTHLQDVSRGVQMLYFVVMGIVWVLPVMLIIKWMYGVPLLRRRAPPPEA